MTGRFAGERVVVVGAGVAGSSAARVLRAEGADVVVTESREASELGSADQLESIGVQVLAGGHDPAHLEGATLLVTGPGVPERAPILAWARSLDIPVWGEMELGARLCDVPYIAVTGTNGKTTTTAMIAACLQADGVDAVACGNIGHPFPEATLEGHKALVVECSSFQLAIQTSLHPKVSVLLNLASDHLDWHGTLGAYREAKAAIFARQGAGDVHVANLDDEAARDVSSRATCQVTWFTQGEPAEGQLGYIGDHLVARTSSGDRTLGEIGEVRAGYRADAAAAAAAALAFDAGSDAVRAGLSAFTPPPHRGETIIEVDGVRFIDNSKATNVHAAIAAIRAEPHAVLIAGGRAKGVDLAPLREAGAQLSAVVAIGESAPELVKVFQGVVPVDQAATIEAAVAEAFDLAKISRSAVLLAPACASWDQFSDYAERGDRFAAAARALGQVVGADGRP